MTDAPAAKRDPKKSDLGVRTLSAIVMLAVAGGALWLGGWWWNALVAAIAIGVLWEWWNLVRAFAHDVPARSIWIVGGLLYVVVAALTLTSLRQQDAAFYGSPGDNVGLLKSILLVTLIIGVDVGAYFAGRTIGGPKIAPKISPSKTWAGLGGGILGAFAIFCAYALLLVPYWFDHPVSVTSIPTALVVAIVVACLAQAGDFFESWMKRRAGVKDSGNLIPGHGGLFDRVDGLLAVSFVIGVLSWTVGIWII
ncbi:MAG: phosphatidate cytidylyltransferase [Erythrobacter sp.]|nr:phosphatidate cytidylyltransferase [Erythrobacter sp.]